MKTLLMIAALAAVSGCASLIDQHTPPPKDWPQLTVRDNVLGPIDIQRRCYKYVATHIKLLGGFAMGCAEINFDMRTCDIYRAHDAAPDIMEHEYAHCRGFGHPGDTTLADAWRGYKAAIAGEAVARHQ